MPIKAMRVQSAMNPRRITLALGGLLATGYFSALRSISYPRYSPLIR
jgi:hypothetical protein